MVKNVKNVKNIISDYFIQLNKKIEFFFVCIFYYLILIKNYNE